MWWPGDCECAGWLVDPDEAGVSMTQTPCKAMSTRTRFFYKRFFFLPFKNKSLSKNCWVENNPIWVILVTQRWVKKGRTQRWVMFNMEETRNWGANGGSGDTVGHGRSASMSLALGPATIPWIWKKYKYWGELGGAGTGGRSGGWSWLGPAETRKILEVEEAWRGPAEIQETHDGFKK